ncbi:hypothetical protein C7C46_29285 [Streptomyces tateyamensis]|uniref:Carrier domain-containing protein n=1 Tax=Streptomyces tateyamensis TaxID=565073 RepID=A0A2V4N5Z3_9ACTN|nr:acyl carrier protein [Streptomyces tateyamensis]PYC68195.1 hypothetical protein C7C46_29285 [Streptomyces tateyamensis]
MTVDAAARTEAVTAIVRRVLEAPQAGPEEDFFELGGDSLLATRVLSAIAREFGVELTFDDFLMAPTGAALAERVAALGAGVRERTVLQVPMAEAPAERSEVGA